MNNLVGFEEFKNLIILFLMFSIPGWFLLSFTGFWKKWTALQRWITSIGIGISFYPVLFYFSRLLIPDLKIGLNKVLFLGLLFLTFIVIKEFKNFKLHFQFDTYELIAIGIIFLTLLTRILILRTHPFPAWTDSLHHTLLTKLVAMNGQLPYTLEPFETVKLSMYHLGLYAITGTFTFLTSLPAHTSLLWVSQLFSGLCGIGIYLFLDKYVDRKAAIIGLIVSGLFSFQPNWYFNWGRFTQLSAQTLMIIAFVLNIESINHYLISRSKSEKLSSILFASLLNAGVFLMHFRVAIFYFGLIFVFILFEIIKAIQSKKLFRLLILIISIAVLSIIFISPSIFQALSKYLEIKPMEINPNKNLDFNYYQFALSSYFTLGLHKWMVVLTMIFLIIGLLRKNKWQIKLFIWVLGIIGIGYLYLLRIPFLMVTNLGAILIMLYIPSALIIGIGFGELEKLIPKNALKNKLFAGFLILAIFFSFVRLYDLEESRFFLSNDDVEAMNWINENLPLNTKIGVRTMFWLENSPHGIDGGFWIPYFTGRKTTTGTMLFSLGPKDYVNEVNRDSKLMVDLFNNQNFDEHLQEICESKIEYIYWPTVPENQKFTSQNFYQVIFSNNKVEILKVNCD